MMRKLAMWVLLRMHRVVMSRGPDSIIGRGADAFAPDYIRRWWIVPRNRMCNVYLHCFGRSDDDRAHHDHPWLFNASLILSGELIEHTIAAGGVSSARRLTEGDLRIRLGRSPHRLELVSKRAWTLFVTGPRVRPWGFHCPSRWVPWQEFTDPQDSGRAGRGCGDAP